MWSVESVELIDARGETITDDSPVRHSRYTTRVRVQLVRSGEYGSRRTELTWRGFNNAVLGIPVVERAVDRTELYVADEVFSCGTAAEISPIVAVDKYQVGDGGIGPVTRELERVFDGVLRGGEDRFAHWRTPVGVAVPA